MTTESPGAVARFGPYEGNLVEVPCPLCATAPPPDLVYASKSGVRYQRCPSCSLLFASPRFDEPSLGLIYENESFLDLTEFEGWTFERFEKRGGRSWNTVRLKADLVEHHLPPGARVLDAGCATGLLCAALSRRGFEAEGIDISMRLTQVARSVVGITAFTSDLQSFRPARGYQGIVVWDVLEHLSDPIRLLRECRRLLEPGGFLFAQVPNSAGISNRFKSLVCRAGLSKADFHHFGFPYHLAFYNRRSLATAFRSADLEPVSFESWSHVLKEGRSNKLVLAATRAVRQWCISDYIIGVARAPSGGVRGESVAHR